jgi:hypothetical protein
MKHWSILLPAAALLTGCGPDMMSLHPLYTPSDVVFEEALLGRWLHVEGRSSEVWRFERQGEDAYELRVDDDKPIACRLVRLSNYLFLDASAVDAGDTGIRGHMFFRVELDRDTLRLASPDDKWLREKLAQNALAHERVRDGKRTTLVIRASTLDLQAFFLNGAADPRAFPEWTSLSRSAEAP